ARRLLAHPAGRRPEAPRPLSLWHLVPRARREEALALTRVHVREELSRDYVPDFGHERARRQIRDSTPPPRPAQFVKALDVFHAEAVLGPEVLEPRDHPVQTHHPNPGLSVPAPPSRLDLRSK